MQNFLLSTICIFWFVSKIDCKVPVRVIKMYTALIFRCTLCSCKIHVKEFLAFACNAKSFAIAFLAFFFLFILPNAVFGRTGKSFLFVSSIVTQEACDLNHVYSLDTLTKVFVSVLFIVKFRVYDLNMPCYAMLRPRDKLKPLYLCCYSVYGNQTRRKVTCLEGFFAIKLHDPLITLSS